MPDAGRIEKAKKLFKQGKSPSEIAAELGISAGTVRSWKSRYKWGKNPATRRNGATQRCAVSAQEPDPLPEEALTEKEQLFCQIYVRNFNATQAAVKAGYSPDTAYSIGYENLRKPRIRAYVERLKEAKRSAIMMGLDDLVEKYMRIAFSDMTDFVDFGRELVPVMGAFGPVTAKNPVTGEDVPVMKEVNAVRFRDSSVVDGGLISSVKVGKDGASIKLLDSQRAMEWLANYFEANPADRHKREYDEKRLALEERAVKVQEDKLHGVTQDVDKIREGLQSLMDVIRSPVPDRKIEDE